ncbi:hypothetical protein GCM10015536_05130 [Streptomyces griseomycini]|nr:hypothetical protein GCM10015536_05130 [Streptomyces griseomycini]
MARSSLPPTHHPFPVGREVDVPRGNRTPPAAAGPYAVEDSAGHPVGDRSASGRPGAPDGVRPGTPRGSRARAPPPAAPAPCGAGRTGKTRRRRGPERPSNGLDRTVTT